MTTLGIGSGAAIAGLLGMNLKNFMEDWEYGFPLITSLAFGTSMLVCGYGLTRLKRIQKLTLYGRYPGVNKKNRHGLMPYEDNQVAEDIGHMKWWKWKWMTRGYGDDDDAEYARRRIKWWKRMFRGR
jgi:hypothetical protein